MCVGLFSYSSSGGFINLLVCLSWILSSYGLLSVKLPYISSLWSSHTLSFFSIFTHSDDVSSTPSAHSIFLSDLLSIYLSLLSFLPSIYLCYLSFTLSFSAIFPSLYLSLLSFLHSIYLYYLSFPLSFSAIFPSLYLSLLSFLPSIFLCLSPPTLSHSDAIIIFLRCRTSRENGLQIWNPQQRWSNDTRTQK